MMVSRRIHFWLACAAIAAVFGVSAGWWATSGWWARVRYPLGVSPPVPDRRLAQQAAAAVCVKFESPDEILEAAEQFRRGVRDALASLPPEDRLEPSRAEQFALLAEERLHIFLSRDYQAYRAHHQRLSAADRSGNRRAKPGLTREQFDRSSARFADVMIAPGDVELAVLSRSGRPSGIVRFGQVVRAIDEKGWYSDAGAAPLSPSLGADAYEARFPLEFPDAQSGAFRRGFVGFVLIWLPSEGRWLPWQTVILDPTPTGAVTFPPPI